MYRVTKNKYGTWEVWRADRLVRAFWEESEARIYLAGLQIGEQAARGEITNHPCDYCDAMAVETVIHRNTKHKACASCANVARAAEYARKALRGRK